MPAFGKLVEKAFYLGVGLAAYASERGGETLNQMRSQIEKLAEEMEARGQMTTEEARRFVEEMIQQAQQSQGTAPDSDKTTPPEPRLIEIVDVEEVEEKDK
ncbi:hypothetical protein [Cylindrospermopsis raciborskii]|uniref:hypothetical protein n=1 Tax=Cylindrospermopsis raciborskii TaxID=77022 RepID=UPI0038D0734C